MNKSYTAKKKSKKSNSHKIVKQLYSNKRLKKKRKQDNLNLYNITILGILKNITEGKLSV